MKKIISLLFLTMPLGTIFVYCISQHNNPVMLHVTKNHGGINLSLPAKAKKTESDTKTINKALTTLLKSPEVMVKHNPNAISGVLNKKQFSLRVAKQHERKNPVWCFDECALKKCCITRSVNPQIRPFFEKKVIASIKEIFPDKQKPIVYTSLGSGNLFQDIIILTHLVNTGYKAIHVNLIEPGLKAFIHYAGICDNTINFESKLTDKKLSANFGINKKDYQNQIQSLKKYLSFTTYKFSNFLDWFNNKHNAKVSLSIYGNTADYIHNCLREPKLMTDILVGIDYVEEGTAARTAKQDYLALALKALKAPGLTCSLYSIGITKNFELAIYQKNKIDVKLAKQNQNDFINIIELKNTSKIQRSCKKRDLNYFKQLNQHNQDTFKKIQK